MSAEAGVDFNTNNGGEPIPFPLQEIGEIPDGFVPVYRVVNRDDLPNIAAKGLLSLAKERLSKPVNTSDESQEIAEWRDQQQNREELLDRIRQQYNIPIKRNESVFAYPRHPNQITYGLTYHPEKQVVLEAYVDPDIAIVLDGEYVTEAGFNLLNKYPQEAEEDARTYWKSRMSLWAYLDIYNNNYDPDSRDDDIFTFPEVLIPHDIPTNLIRVVPEEQLSEEV